MRIKVKGSEMERNAAEVDAQTITSTSTAPLAQPFVAIPGLLESAPESRSSTPQQRKMLTEIAASSKKSEKKNHFDELNIKQLQGYGGNVDLVVKEMNAFDASDSDEDEDGENRSSKRGWLLYECDHSIDKKAVESNVYVMRFD